MKTPLLLAIAGVLLAAPAQAQWAVQPFTFKQPDNVPLYVDAVDANTAWALSSGLLSEDGNLVNEVARTFDGGKNWTVLPIPAVDLTSETLQSLSAVSATTAWVVTLHFTEASRVLRTTNAGATWTVQSTADMFSQQASYPFAIHFFNANDGVVLGDPDGRAGGGMEIYTTSNGGTTWVRAAAVPVGTAGEFGTPFPPAAAGNSIWFGNDEGDIFRSADKGVTWAVTRKVAADPIENIAFRDEQNGLALIGDAEGTRHRLYRSTDGGASWNPLSYSGPLRGFGLTSVPGNRNYVAVGLDYGNGDAGSSYSQDNGQTWIGLENNLNHLFVDAAGPTAVWSGAIEGRTFVGLGAYKLTSPVLGSRSSTLVLGASLSPNPSSTGQFRMQWPAAAHAGPATLTVFDALGRQVLRQGLNASQRTEAMLDLSGRRAGIYQVKLESGSGVSQLRAQVL